MGGLIVSHDVPANRCIHCRRGRRKVGLWCRLCADAIRRRKPTDMAR